MKIRKHRLIDDDGQNVPFSKTKNKGGKLVGGKPAALIIHYTAGDSASGAIRWFKNRESEASAHLVIDHDGSITQMVDFDTVGWHAGTSRWRGGRSVNRYSVGIEIVNWGKLSKSGSGEWVSRTGSSVASTRVIVAEHKHSPGKEHGWEMFREPQMDACLRAAKAIVTEYEIKPWDLVGHDDITPRRKIDPGPAFDMDAFRSQVFGRMEDSWNSDLYRVIAEDGLNMRRDPSLAKKPLKNLPKGTVVHLIEKTSTWWLVAEVLAGNDDVTGFVHSSWLEPVESV